MLMVVLLTEFQFHRCSINKLLHFSILCTSGDDGSASGLEGRDGTIVAIPGKAFPFHLFKVDCYHGCWLCLVFILYSTSYIASKQFDVVWGCPKDNNCV